MSLNFGNPSSAPAATLGAGFSFGANKPTFGLGSSAPGGGFTFGSPAATSAPTFATPSMGFSTPATAATGLGFAPLTTTTTSASTRFGLDNLTSAASTGLTFGGANTNAHKTSGGFTINPAIGTPGTQSFGLGPPPTSAAPLFVQYPYSLNGNPQCPVSILKNGNTFSTPCKRVSFVDSFNPLRRTMSRADLNGLVTVDPYTYQNNPHYQQNGAQSTTMNNYSPLSNGYSQSNNGYSTRNSSYSYPNGCTPYVVNQSPGPPIPCIVNQSPATLTPYVVNQGPATLTPYVVNQGPAPVTPYVVNQGPAPVKPYIVNQGPATLTPYVVNQGPAPVTPYIVNQGPAPLTPYVANQGPAPVTPYIVNQGPAPLTRRGALKAPTSRPHIGTRKLRMKSSNPKYRYMTPNPGLKAILTTATTQPSLTGAPPFVGLGGVEASGGSTLPGIGASPWSVGGVVITGGTAGTGANEQPRHQKLSNELLQTVDAFKGFVKQQKSLSSDVARASIKPLQKVSTSLDALSTSILTATANVRTSRTSARRLRESSAKALATAEEAGTGGLFSSGAPELLIALVADHEAVVRRFAMQVDAAVRQMHGGTRTLTEQDLTMGMRRMHEMLVALAGRLAALGTQVNELKQFYLNLRRHRLNLTDDVFHQQDQNTLRDTTMLTNVLNQLDDRKQYLNTTNSGGSSYQANSVVIADPRLALANPKASIVGPTPFTYLGPPGFGGYPFVYSSPSRENNPQMSAATQGGFGSPWNIPQQNTLSFPGSAVSPLSNPLPTDNSSSFQLQKPPTGYKRGKH